MKTIGDIERWLKGAGKDWQMTLYVTRNEITVVIDKTSNDGVVTKSKTLEGALENALEELQRKENGAESMRSEKTTTTNLPAKITLGTSSSYRTWGGGPGMLPPPTYACAIHGYYTSLNGSGCPVCAQVLIP
jgi:hypothetical protein